MCVCVCVCVCVCGWVCGVCGCGCAEWYYSGVPVKLLLCLFYSILVEVHIAYRIARTVCKELSFVVRSLVGIRKHF